MAHNIFHSLSEGIGTLIDFGKVARTNVRTRELRREIERRRSQKEEVDQPFTPTGNIFESISREFKIAIRGIEEIKFPEPSPVVGEEGKREIKKLVGAATQVGKGIPSAIIQVPSQIIGGVLEGFQVRPGENIFETISRQRFGGEVIAEKLVESPLGKVPGLAPVIGLAAEIIIPGGGQFGKFGKGKKIVTPKVAKVISETPKPLGLTTAKKLAPEDIPAAPRVVIKTTADSAIQKLTKALREAKPIRAEQEALFSAERARRVGRIAAVGAKIPGEKGFFAQLGQLK